MGILHVESVSLSVDAVADTVDITIMYSASPPLGTPEYTEFWAATPYTPMALPDIALMLYNSEGSPEVFTLKTIEYSPYSETVIDTVTPELIGDSLFFSDIPLPFDTDLFRWEAATVWNVVSGYSPATGIPDNQVPEPSCFFSIGVLLCLILTRKICFSGLQIVNAKIRSYKQSWINTKQFLVRSPR